MKPRKIIIKTIHQNIAKKFCEMLNSYSKIIFFCKKINGEYRITIKCSNYYDGILFPYNSNTYHTYLYLSTVVSLLLCDLFIDVYEEKIISAYLCEYSSFLSKSTLQKIKNITSLMLDQNFPSSHSKSLFYYKKNLIFQQLLSHFKNQNHLYIDAFAFFSLENYHSFLERIVLESFEIFLYESFDKDFIIFILNNFFK